MGFLLNFVDWVPWQQSPDVCVAPDCRPAVFPAPAWEPAAADSHAPCTSNQLLESSSARKRLYTAQLEQNRKEICHSCGDLGVLTRVPALQILDSFSCSRVQSWLKTL